MNSLLFIGRVGKSFCNRSIERCLAKR